MLGRRAWLREIEAVERELDAAASAPATRRASRRHRLAYDAASRGRLVSNWNPGSRGPNDEIGSGAPLSRDRARDLARNNPLARRALDVWVGDLVGAGVFPQIIATRKDGKRDKGASQRAEDLHAAWAETCVVDSDLGLGGWQGLMVRSMCEAGESLGRRRPRRIDDGLPVPLQLEGLESDLLDASQTASQPNGGRIVQGVEFDAIGRRRGYWLYPSHPGESWPIGTAGLSSRFVPASEIVHLFEPGRLGQVRSISWLAPVAVALRDLDDYHLAERTRKKHESSITAMVTVDDPAEEAITAQLDADSDEETEDERPYLAHTVHGLPAETNTPGTTIFIRGSKDVKLSSPASVLGVQEYERVVQRAIAAGARLTYEHFGDLSQVNWASYRAGYLVYRRTMEVVRQTVIAPMLLAPVFRWWLAAARVAGLLDDRLTYTADWTFPAFQSVNRLDDIKADILEREARLNSRQRQLRERARDPETITREIEEDEADLKARGLLSVPADGGASLARLALAIASAPAEEMGE